MSELARSFGDVADAYELGRPRFAGARSSRSSPQAAGGPRLLDVGAGTGRLSGPLLEMGYDVVAVEPLDGHARHPRAEDRRRPRAGGPRRGPPAPRCERRRRRSAATPGTGSTAPARPTSSHRVVRPGGGVVVCVLRFPPEFRPAWVQESEELLRARRWEAVRHPYRDGAKRPDGLEGHPGFEPLEVREVPFIDHSDRERIVAHWHSMSAVASLEPAERTRVPRRDRRHPRAPRRARRSTCPYPAELWITRRRPAPALPRRSSGSGELTSIGAPVTGCAKASRAACRNWRSRPRRPRRPVLGVADDRVIDGLQVGADLVGAPGLQAHAQQRGARQRLLDLEVRHRRARIVGVGRHPRAHAPVAPQRARRSCRCAPAGAPRPAPGTRA